MKRAVDTLVVILAAPVWLPVLALAMALVFTVGWVPVFVISVVVLAIWIAVAAVIMRKNARQGLRI